MVSKKYLYLILKVFAIKSLYVSDNAFLNWLLDNTKKRYTVFRENLMN